MSDIWSLLKTANDALKPYFLCVPPYRCVNGEYLNEINESISAGKDPSLKVRGSINLPWQRAYQFEYRYKKCKIFEPFMPAIEYATYDAMEGNWICAYLSFLTVVEAVLRKWADEQSLTFERMKGIAPALVKHMQSQKYFPDERIAITDGYIDYFQYILCEVLYEGFDGYKLKSFSDIFNRNLSLHKLEGVMDISEGLTNVTRILLVLDIIAELYFMQNPEDYWATTFHADPENNVDFQLRWKLYTKHSMLAIGPNDRLIIQNVLLNHVDNDIKKATTAKLDFEIKLLSGNPLQELRKMAKKKVEEKINLDSILFKCRDILRAARNSGSFFEKRDMMLTLVFLRFIGEKFEDGVEKLRQDLIAQGLDPDDEEIFAAFFDDATFTDGTYNLPVEARWSTIINTPAPGLNVALDTALHSIATSSKQLKGCFVEGTFTTRNLAANDIKKIVDEVNKISHKAFGEEKDLIGRVYEYFLKEFAVNATKEEGEFYTPHDAVQLIAAMIEPFDGTLYDPCCGSGGMFVQSADLIKEKKCDISRINIYGQEKEPATYRLAKMNLALRGISHNLGDEADSTFTHDLHKGIYFDYIMANPPFNLKGWYDENLKNDSRWQDYVTPPESNANYAWILHMLSHLRANKGVAGFLLANGALGDSDTLEIRKKLIQNDKVEAIIILPRELFITTDISVTLWLLNQNKKGGEYHGRTLRNRENEILFMDLRTWVENPVKNEGKKKVFLSDEQIQRAAAIYHTWQNEGTDGTNYAIPELYRSVTKDIIEGQGWSLVPSKYIEFIDHDLDIDFNAEMSRIQAEMREVLVQEKQSQKMLEDAFRGIGYEL